VAHGAAFAPDAQTDHIHLDPVPASVALARRYVQDQATSLSDDEQATLTLLTSELVTNAIMHARTSFQLGVVRDDEHFLVAVADRVTSTTGMEALAWSAERPGGRGLALVEALAEQWGTTPAGRGKSVWFTVPVADALSGPYASGQRAG
jgi:anti-sigma regulatory factor (Ser/Thr protein kinase)